MSAEALEFLVIVLGSLAVIAGVVAMWNVFVNDAEEQQAERERLQILRELDRHRQ